MKAKEKFYKLLDHFEENNVLQNDPEENIFPPEITIWLAKLRLLSGVPIYYLVPDERMLPPESIRFFHIDPNWVAALTDGARSLGRNNPKSDTKSVLFHSNFSESSLLQSKVLNSVTSIRSKYLGLPDCQSNEVDMNMSGFILRSDLVKDYPGLSVDAFDNNDRHLTILRMERIGNDSDLLLCIFAGDIAKVDIHEAPESLHYGFSFEEEKSRKKFHIFNKIDSKIEILKEEESVELNDCYRKESKRVLDIASLAKKIGEKINMPLTAAEMGFVMTEGIGMVSFTTNKTAKE